MPDISSFEASKRRLSDIMEKQYSLEDAYEEFRKITGSKYKKDWRINTAPFARCLEILNKLYEERKVEDPENLIKDPFTVFHLNEEELKKYYLELKFSFFEQFEKEVEKEVV